MNEGTETPKIGWGRRIAEALLDGVHDELTNSSTVTPDELVCYDDDNRAVFRRDDGSEYRVSS